MKGYIDVLGNAAPRFSLHQTALMEAKDYKQLDALHKKVRFDPVYSERAVLSPGGNMVADGPNALVILRSLGLDDGPPFPGQADVSPAFTEYINIKTFNVLNRKRLRKMRVVPERYRSLNFVLGNVLYSLY